MSEMSMTEDDITPTMTGGATPTTQTGVPVTTGPLTTTDSGTIPQSTVVPAFYPPAGPRHHDGILYQQSKMYQHLYQQQPLWWGHFNPDSTEEMYVLTRGPRRDSWFDVGLCEDVGYPQYEVAGQRWVTDCTQERSDCCLKEDEEYDVDARVEALERGQQEMRRDLEEVILTIPDIMI
ncbi:UNVERIFIED_CONTAM: hypothetical protein K2H54_003021 [Gekko kuhli]